MTKTELAMLQALPLEVKVKKSLQRIKEWVDFFGKEGVYVSFSGGKDSTVLLHLVRSIYPEVPAVFVDTGLEYPEIRSFCKSFDNVTFLKPRLNFKQVIETYGYPVVSKEQANYLDDIRNSTEKMRLRRLNGDSKGRFKLSKKWRYLIDAPFKVSHRCCSIMKKEPAKKYEKQTGRVPFIGTLAEESSLRTQEYLKSGCNAFNNTRKHSTPLAFWTEQDILRYIKQNNIEVASVYGELLETEQGLKFSGCDRTGCVFCGFGVHLEKSPNRFQRLKVTHPKLYIYCMDKLGFDKVLNYMNIEH